ncbi:tetratricopeptide repeat protein [uncultured Mailhella sp.]|uniref:tetratricopeptide repeat protein n=1 Tax=uncultured Mailhella sp. TaxID=1981031 RepID=UPI0025EBC839|nr:tetratricopeptide repeat protein [uncultured Mailhella sp.]
MFASTLALMLLPAGCTATGNGISSGQNDQFVPAQMTPQAPSQRAELIFAQLKLDSALAGNDREGIIDSASRLLRYGTGTHKLPSSSPIIDAAIWLLAHDDEKEAVPLIKKASAQMPDDLALVSLQADLLIQNNRRSEAIDLLRTFARNHPADGQAQAELALALLRSGQAEEAMQVFRHIPEKQLTAQIRFAYAQALNVSGHFADARRQLEAAVKEEPEYSEAWQLLALTQEELGNRKEAEKIYRNILQDDPDNRSARLFLLRLLLQNGETDTVVRMVMETQDPLHFAVAAAAMLMDEKHPDQAESLLSRLETQDGMPDGLYFYHAALLYESGGSIDRALDYLDRVSPQSSEYDKALRMKVRILYEQKEYSAALAALETLRTLHPTDVEPLLLVSEMYAAQKNFAEAEKAVDEALRLHPDNENAAFQQAYLQEMQGNRKKAMALMEKFSEKYPDNALALNYVGYNLADSNRELDKAYRLILRAVELEPDTDFILDSLAWVHFRRGELDEAWEQIQKALNASGKDGPRDPAMLEHYGDIAAARQDVDSARTGWQQALKIFEELGYPEDAARVRQKLEKLQ